MGCYKSAIERQPLNVTIPEHLMNLRKQMQAQPYSLLENNEKLEGKQSMKWYRSKNFYPQYSYKGQWLKGFIHGKGVLYNDERKQLIYGIFHTNRLVDDKCVKLLNSGQVYVGTVDKSFYLQGRGELRNYRQFTLYKGQFLNNQISGKGICKLYTKNFEKIVQTRIGHFWKNQFANGSVITDEGMYQGTFKNNKIQGMGIFIWKDGGKYVGQFRNGKKNGKGILFDRQGVRVRVGIWQNDQISY